MRTFRVLRSSRTGPSLCSVKIVTKVVAAAARSWPFPVVNSSVSRAATLANSPRKLAATSCNLKMDLAIDSSCSCGGACLACGCGCGYGMCFALAHHIPGWLPKSAPAMFKYVQSSVRFFFRFLSDFFFRFPSTFLPLFRPSEKYFPSESYSDDCPTLPISFPLFFRRQPAQPEIPVLRFLQTTVLVTPNRGALIFVRASPFAFCQ